MHLFTITEGTERQPVSAIVIAVTTDFGKGQIAGTY